MCKRFLCLAVVAALAIPAVAADKKPASSKNNPTNVSPPWQPVTSPPAKGPVKNSPDSVGKTPRPPREARTSPAGVSDAPGTVYEALQKKACIEWEDEPLANVIDWLREQGDINVVVMWKDLEQVAVDKETPISLELCDLSVRDVLSEICRQLSPAGGVGFEASGNLVRIATQEYFDRVLYLRVYNVADVAMEVPDFSPCGLPIYGWNGSEYVQVSDNSNFDSLPRHMLLTELADQIRSTVAPGLWDRDGGPYSITIDRWRWNLIVKAPISVHEQIGGPFYR